MTDILQLDELQTKPSNWTKSDSIIKLFSQLNNSESTEVFERLCICMQLRTMIDNGELSVERFLEVTHHDHAGDIWDFLSGAKQLSANEIAELRITTPIRPYKEISDAVHDMIIDYKACVKTARALAADTSSRPEDVATFNGRQEQIMTDIGNMHNRFIGITGVAIFIESLVRTCNPILGEALNMKRMKHIKDSYA